jgi:Methyltransferase FkbM domain
VIPDQSEVAAFTVRRDTIDRLVADGTIPPPTFVKVDVEGHEAAALKGAAATVAQHRPVLAIDLHHPQADRSVGRFLIDHDYVAFRQLSLQPIADLRHGWPVPDGIHGPVLAMPRSDTQRYSWLLKR